MNKDPKCPTVHRSGFVIVSNAAEEVTSWLACTRDRNDRKRCVRTGGADGTDVSGHPYPSAHLPAASQTAGWETQDKKLMCDRDVTGQQDRSLSAPGQVRKEHANPARFSHLKIAQQA